ncbi:hypothetical protein ACWEKM_38255 [Streptomyces sp. NPDC004752]
MDSAGWGCLVEIEDFRLEYVGARGDLHEGPLEVMWPARFEAAGQARTFPSYRGQRNFPGWYWAATCAELVGYESWVELGQLGPVQDAVGPDPVPHDVTGPGNYLPAVRPRSAPVRRPGVGTVVSSGQHDEAPGGCRGLL